MQHAIQKEQGSGTGRKPELAYAALVSDAYEAVKIHTGVPKSANEGRKKLRYLEETAVRKTGAANMEDAAKKIYTNLGGEKMARQTALRWPFDDTRRENRWPDVAGQGLDKAAERAVLLKCWEG